MRIFTSQNNRYICNQFKAITFLLLVLLSFGQVEVKAEGTKQLNPTSADVTDLNFNRASAGQIPFAIWDCPTDYRLNIKICNAGEKIYLGFKASFNNIYFRLKDPSGTVVLGPTLIPSGAAPGFIANYAQAVAGPQQLGIAGGYNAIVYTSLAAGDYSIEFNQGSGAYVNSEFNVRLFDITVANGPTAGDIKLGRLWSKDWQMDTQSYTNRFKGTMYVYANDGIVTNINFNGMQPYKFHIACNSKGTINTGNFASDRMSVVGNQTFPEYKIFLNDPDLNCYPTGTFGNINGQIDVTGCAPNYCINVNIKDKAGAIGVILDLNGVPGYQINTKDVSIGFNAVIGPNCIPWNGKDGLGNIVASGTNFNIQIDFFNGLTNLPLYDAEENQNGFIVSLVRPAGPAPQLFWDDSQITAGNATDGKQNLTGCTPASPIGCHRWTGRGINSGTGAPPESINTWWYANIQTQKISFNALQVDVDADASNPGKGAGNAKTVCGDGSAIPLNASKVGNDATTWTTSGTGTFSSTTILNPTYTPSAADLTSGSVVLTIKTSGSSCPIATDFIPLTLQKMPTVNAGATINVCENNPNAQLAATSGNGVSAILWTGGTGSFAPNNTTLNAIYTPSAAEITAGTVTLNLSSTAGNGVCSAASGSVTIAIAKSPIVNAGTTTTLCANNPVVTLAGNIGNGAINPKWTGGTGTFGNINSVNTTYTPTAAEVTAGTVTLHLTADKANCNSVTSNVIITFTAAPTVNAGPNQSLCENNPLVTLNGTSTATAVQWVGGTGTFTPNRSTKNATYLPTAAEIASASVSLTLQTISSGGCSVIASSPMKITFTGKPTVNAGADMNVCSNKPTANIKGVITGATGATWTGQGGAFVPNNTSLTTSYVSSAAEVSGGLTFLILTTTGNGTCLPVSDTLQIVMDPNPTADAGPDVKICKNNLTVTLAGSTNNNTLQTWTTSGTGTFNNVNLLNAVYTPSQADTLGNVTLTLKSNRPGCNEVSDPMVISFTNKPVVRAGADVSVCDNNPIAQISGFSSTGTGVWSGGTGTFTATTYKATAAEASAATPITLTYTSTNNGTCTPVSDQMVVSFYKAPTVNAGIDQNICSNNININLVGTSSTGTARWQGGNGTFSPDSLSLSVSYIPTAAEITAGSVNLTLTSKNNVGCIPVSDGIKITFTPKPTISLTPNQNSCANKAAVILAATITNAGGGIWSNGGGVFANGTTSLNNTYTPSASEIQKGKAVIKLTTTNNGNCNPVTDSVIIAIAPAPIVNAGADQVVCGDVTSVNLAGLVTNATGGTWTKVAPATGTFGNANIVNTTYNPSLADIDSGYVKLNLTSTGNGTCLSVNDTVRVFFTVVPTINAGPDQTVCTNDFPVKLNAFGSPGVWSGGAGTFSPSTSTLNATYTPTVGEISSGSITLTFSTNPSATCSSKKDNVKITIKPAPIVDAGGVINACSNSAGIQLGGTVTNATGGKWSTLGTGTFSPNVNTLNAQYIPSANDINIENLKLTLTSTGNGFCPAVNDTLLLSLQPAPNVNAGPDQSYCANNATIQLNGVMQNINGLGGIWTGGAGTFTPNNKVPNATYKPTAAEIASGTLTLTYSSVSNGICPVKSDNATFTFTPAPTTTTGVDRVICENAIPVNVTATSTIATSGIWTSSGTGSFAPSNIGTTSSYFPTTTDISNGFVDLVYQTSNNGTCLAVKDTIHIDFTLLPIVNAGIDTLVCKDIVSLTLYGSASQIASSKWTTSGTGTFDDDTKTDAVYTPSAADKTAGTITLTLTGIGNGSCGNKLDKMVIKFSPIPVVTAGTNRIICADVNDVAVLGKITNAGGGIWSTSGSGTFLNTDSLQTTYTPSVADKTTGLVTLTLTSTQNGVCSPSTSSFTIKIDPIPTITVGTDRTICADSSGISLVATLTNASGANWASNGSGTYSPSANVANSQYTPSIADRTKGTVKIWATSNGSGTCNNVTDTLDLTIVPAPIVNAGTNISICKDNTTIALNGTVTNATSGLWTSSGTGTFNPNNTTLNGAYLPSVQDKASGNIILTLKSTGNGLCKAVGNQITVNFTPIPVVNAGADKTLCSTTESINLSGTVTIATGAIWTSIGGGSILPSNTSLTPIYYPTASEITNGKAVLVLTSTGNGTCSPVNDTVQYIFQKAPIAVVNAGPSNTICADQSSAPISATVTNSPSFVWTTLGSGTFSPSNSILNTNYVPTAADITAGKVDLVISTLNNGVCPNAKDTLTITITPKPTITVGSDVTVCTNLENINLNAVITNAKGVKWTSSGSGNFSPIDTVLTPAYFFSPLDISLGSIVLTASTTGNGLCKAVYADQVIVSFSPAPVVNAGPDFTTCIGNGAIQLNGTITNSANGGTWVTSGTGTFSSTTLLNATYTPSAADEASGGTVITLISNPTTNCQSFSDDFTITYSAAPVINAGNDSTYCTNTLPIQLKANGASGTWSGGTGTFFPNTATLEAIYTPSAAELTAGFVTLTIATNPGLCIVTTDNVTFTFKAGPTANAGTDDVTCANTVGGFALTGASNTTATWSTPNNEGTFTPDANSLTAKFIPSGSQIANGSVNLILTSSNLNGCPAASDQVLLTITPAPTVNAGFDVTTCNDVTTVSLTGTKSAVSTGVQWTTSSGLGSFSPQDVTTTFTPSNTDKTNGSVSVILTTTGSGLCAEVTDTVDVIFTPAPTVFAGNDTTICASEATEINLKGKITTASGGIWTSPGSGVFSPDPSALSVKYLPTSSEISSGSLTLTLTTTGNGQCLPKNAQVKFTIQAPDTVNAGSDMVVCSDNLALPLLGKSTTTNVKWTTNGTGTFSPDNQLASSFLPSAADKTNGGITLTLTTTNVNSCLPDVDFLTVQFNPIPFLIVNSGFDKIVCISDSTTQLNGFIANAKGGIWTTGGDGTFVPSDTLLDAVYRFGPLDKSSGLTNITLTSRGTGQCSPVSDMMKITYQAVPTVAVSQKVIPACADVDSINISATVVTATSGIWSTSGTGYFAPKADSLASSYFPSKTDASLGIVWLTINSVNNGECGTAEDTVILNFGPSPTIDAGPDKNICRNASSIALKGSATVATGGTWITSGAGTINPNTLVTSYTIATADTAVDAITMTVTSTGQGTCKPVSDDVTFTFDEVPSVDAGPDVIVCESTTGITLTGKSLNTDSVTWVSSGSGTFLPDNRSLTAMYIPSTNDLQNPTVTLSLSSNQNNACIQVSDQMSITFEKPAVINLNTAPACYSSKGIDIAATLSNSTGGKWFTTGTGNFSPSNTSLIGQYFFGLGDISNTIQLYFVTTPTVCPADTASKVLFVNLLPNVNAGKDEFVCQNNSITLSTNATPNFQYQWTEVGGGIVGNASFVTVNIPTSKLFELKVTDVNNCSNVDTVAVEAISPVTFGLAPSICLDPYFLINALPSSYNPNGSFQWYKDGSLMQGKQDTTIYASEAGKYVVVYNIGQCSSKDSTQVHPLPIMVNKGKIACIGSSTIIKTTNLPSGSYTWQAPLTQVNSNSNNVNPVVADTNFYYVTGKDVFSCETTDSIRVIGIEKPILTLSDANICAGDTLTLKATPSNINKFNGFTIGYDWFKDNVDQNKHTSSYFVSINGQYIANVTIGDCKAADTSNVKFNTLPIVNLGDTIIFCPKKETITLDAGTPHQAGTKYLWTITDLSSPTPSTSTATTETILVKVKTFASVIVTDTNNCKANDDVFVKDLCEPQIYIPNAFTPGKPGKDQVFQVYGMYFKNFKITIYSRWGEVLFSSNSKEISWDGNYINQEMQYGVYPYIVTFDAEDPKYPSQKIEGSVTILR